MSTENVTTTDATQIDDAINAAKARVAENNGTTGQNSVERRRRLTPEERVTRDAGRAEAANARKVAREEKKLARLAEKEANRKPAHMAKVLKAAERLPELSSEANEVFCTVTSSLSPAEVYSLCEHLSHHVRVERTKAALDVTLEVGNKVTIVSGNPRFIGMTGTIIKAQRIRCYVEVEGYDKEVYLFTSDVELVEQEQMVQSVPSDDDPGNEVPSENQEEEVAVAV